MCAANSELKTTAEIAVKIFKEDGTELSQAGAQPLAMSERDVNETLLQKRPKVKKKKNSWKKLPGVEAALEKNGRK